MEENHRQLIENVQNIVTQQDYQTVLLEVCRAIQTILSGHDWVGFYIADEAKKMLYLGPYVGAHTDHTEIPFGRGICGQAAEREATFVVDDVAKAENYLSCSVQVKSEIVIPVMEGSSVLGELDIDSHTADNFSVQDRACLEKIAELCVKPVKEYLMNEIKN